MKKILFGLFVFSFLMVGLKVSIAEAVDSQVTLFLGNTQSVVFNGQNLELELKTLDGSTGIYSLEVNGILKSASSFGAELSITDSVSLKGISYSAINSVTQSVTLQLLEKISPSITVLTPNGRDMYEVGQQINVTWDSTGIPASSNNIDITLHGYNANGVIVWSKELSSFTLNDGQEKVILPTYLGGVPFGKNFVISVGTDSTNNPSPVFDYSDTTFTIGPATDITNGGCSNSEIYSSTTGQPCPASGTPSITVLSPNGGETFTAGKQITVKWDSKNLPLGAKIRVILDSAWDLIPSYNPSTYYVSNTGSTTFTLPTESDFVKGNPSPWGKNFSFVVSTPMSNSTGALALDLTDDTFTINSSTTTTTDTGCSAGLLFSLITGAPCGNNNLPAGCTSTSGYSSTTGVSCSGTQNVTTTTDLTPRISYWYGKVNQHIDITKKSEFDVSGATWQTDSDGVSGADLDKLTYCKKFYPNTTSVVEYKNEVINSWHDIGNLNNYTSTKMSYACVSGSIIDNGCSNGQGYSSTTGQICPSNLITLFSPQTGSIFKAGQTVKATWSTRNFPEYTYIDVIIKKDGNVIKQTSTINDGQESIKIPLNTPAGKYDVSFGIQYHQSSGGSGTNHFEEYGSATYTIATSSPAGCNSTEGYSNTTGLSCYGSQSNGIDGCLPGQNYSSTTGQICLITVDSGCNGTIFSTITGKLCPMTNTNTSTITTPITRTLKLGIKGDDVKALQAFLNLLADGSFGPKTQAKVMEWQAANGLTADGAFGSISRQKAGLAQ